MAPFSGDEWDTLPWAIIEKSTKDKLIDVMSSIPYILTMLDSLTISDSQDAVDELLNMIWRQCQNAEAALAMWRAQIDLSVYDYTITGFPLLKPQADSDFSLLHLSCTYWSICLMLSCIIESISGDFRISLTSENATVTSFFNPHSRHSNFIPEKYASKIVHCVHLFFEPLAGAVQGSSGFFPMVCAWRFYEMAAKISGQKSAELHFYMIYLTSHSWVVQWSDIWHIFKEACGRMI